MAEDGDVSVARFSFNDFSEEVFFSCLQNLQGGREAARLASVSTAWAEILNPGSGPLWKTFGAQEFGNTNLQAPPAPEDRALGAADFTGVDRYASLARAASLRGALWGRVSTRGFGAREGTPWLFLGRSGEEIFGFGGFGSRGASNDLMVAALAPLKEILTGASAGATPSSASVGATPRDAATPPGQTGAEAEGGAPVAAARNPGPLLDFCHVAPKGQPVMPSYGATATPLVDDELPSCEWLDLDVVRRCLGEKAHLLPSGSAARDPTLFLVTGGYLRGGYHEESPDWSLGIVFAKPAFAPAPRSGSGGGLSEDVSAGTPALPLQRAGQGSPSSNPTEGLPKEAIWMQPGPAYLDADSPEPPRNAPTPRSNATATYVPARFADPSRYPMGYVMLFGGNVDRCASNTMDVLDLSTFTWSIMGELPNAPPPRNSHSAVLMPDEEEPATKAKVLVFGGGTGGDVPRGGMDLADFATFDPRAMSWIGPVIQDQGRLVPGRAHVAVKVARSVLFFGGGRSPSKQLTAMPCQQLSERHAQRVAAAAARAEPEEDSGALEGFDAAWGTLLRSLTWKCVPPLDAQGVPRAAAPCQPPPRAFHAAVSLAPAGVPMLLVYGGWHPRMGNFGDIWAAKLDPWIGDPDRAQEAASARGACGVADRAAEADRRFRGELCPPGSGGPQEGSDDESDFDEHFGRMVNVNGRIIPMQLFVQIMQRQLGREEGTRRIQELLSAQEEGSDEEDDENEESDE